jgi:O-antigen ligase
MTGATLPRLPRRSGALAPPPPPPAPADVTVRPIVLWAFYLLVCSIPFELPDRPFPIEIPTLTAFIFLLATAFDLRACFARRPLAVTCFAVWLYLFAVAALWAGRDPAATALVTPDYRAQVFKLFLQLLEAVLTFWAAYNVLRSPTVARRALLGFAVACSFRALLPLVGIARTARVQWGGAIRVSALDQNANNSAMILAAGLVALLGLEYSMGRPAVRWRWLTWPVIGLLVVSVVDTGSRGGLVALAVGLVVFALGGQGNRWTRVRHAFVVACAVGLLVVATYTSDVMRKRFEDTLESGAAAGRERIYPALLEMFRQRPVLGWGPVNNKYELGLRLDERIRRRRDAHNLVLEVLTSTGLVGAVPFLAGVGLCVAAAWRARHRAHGILPSALAAVLLSNNMVGNWIDSKLLWLVLAYGLASLTYAQASAPARAPADGPPTRLPPTPRGARPVRAGPATPATPAAAAAAAPQSAGAERASGDHLTLELSVCAA